MTLQAPSTTLLRALLKPSPCASCQIRLNSTYMPRHKYAKINRLDKLHRKQKAALKQERQDSFIRADALSIPTTTSTTSSSSSPTQQPSETDTTSPPSSSTLTSLPTPQHNFTIFRTPSHNLPIYESTKSGGSKHITTVRKLSGNLDALSNELRTVLKLPQYIVDQKGRKKETVVVNRLTQHVVVKGWRGPEIKKWAETVGF